MREAKVPGRWARLAASCVLVVAAVAGGLAMEGARSVQGNYELSFINDPYFYRAMAEDLWTPGASLESEAARFAPDIPADEVTKYYGDPVWRDFLHPENGLSHQPPYAYRILVPTVVGWLNAVGIPVPAGFLLLYLVGLALMALSMFRLFTGGWGWSWQGLVVALAPTAAVAIITSSNTVDSVFMGLATLALVAARTGRAGAFVAAAGLAALTRETGAFLAIAWVLFALARGTGWRSLLVGAAPVAAAVLPHLLVSVPNSATDLASSASYLLTPLRIVTRVAVIGMLCVAAWPRRSYPGFARSWPVWLIPVAGAAGALAMSAVALSEARTVLLMFPLLVAAGAWGADWRWGEVLAWGAAWLCFVAFAYLRWVLGPVELAATAAILLGLALGVRWITRRQQGPGAGIGDSATRTVTPSAHRADG